MSTEQNKKTNVTWSEFEFSIGWYILINLMHAGGDESLIQ